MRICFETPSSPSATIASGVGAAANRPRVALLTPASVACAESTTATSKVKGSVCSSSPLGSGLAASKRVKASTTSFFDQRLMERPVSAAAAFATARRRARITTSAARGRRGGRILRASGHD